MIQRADAKSHLQTDMTLHLDLACVKLNKTEDQLRNTQEELHRTQEKFEETTRKLEEKFEETTRKLQEKFEETTTKLTEKVIALENKEMQYSGEHTWKISGFSEILRQAKSGETTSIDSVPFYTGKYGYKFRIGLYPNGNGSGKNTHLSVFFFLMKGDYDDVLTWPFNKKVTFMLVDQQEDLNDQENKVISFIPDKGWQRPLAGDDIIGKGFNKFISHEKLRERRFIVDDTIFIRVKIVLP